MDNQEKEVFANTKTSEKPKVTKIVRTNSINTSINRKDLLQALNVIRTKGKTDKEKMTALNNINGSDWIGYIGDTAIKEKVVIPMKVSTNEKVKHVIRRVKAIIPEGITVKCKIRNRKFSEHEDLL